MSPVGSIIPLVAITLVGVAIGIFLIAFARRAKRVDDHPTCRSCRFDLVGLAVEACPECGDSLIEDRAVRRGNRRVHKPLMALGVLVLVGSLVGGGGVIAVRVGGAEVIQYTPAWWLMRDVRSGSTMSASKALRELDRRVVAGTLDDRWIQELIATALRPPRPRPDLSSGAWIGFMESAWASGKLTAQERADYLMGGVSFEIAGRKRMALNRPVPIEFSASSSRTGSSSLWVEFELLSFEVAGKRTELMIEGDHPLGPSSRGSSISRSHRPLNAELGEHEITTVWKVRLNDDSPNALKPEQTVTLKRHVMIVGENEPIVELIHEPKIGADVRSKLNLELLAVTADGKACNIMLAYSGLPCRVIGRVVLRERHPPDGQKLREWEANDFSLSDSTGNFRTGWSQTPLFGPGTLDLAEVDVVLRPSADMAANEPRVEKIWGEEVVFEGVKVERVK